MTDIDIAANRQRPSYVALIATIRAEFQPMSLEALWIQMRGHRYNTTSLGVLAQAVHDAQDPTYDAGEFGDVPALLAKVDELTAEREHMELNPTGTAEWLKNRVNELTAALAERDAQLTQSREQAATYANEIGTLTAENARVRQQRDETKAGVQRLIAFRNAKVYEVDELAQRLRTVRALAEGPHGEGDFGSVPARDLLNAIGEEHPAESRPVVVLDSTDKAEVAR